MLSNAEAGEFERTGLVRLPAAVPTVDAVAMADRIWSFLSHRAGVDQADAGTWPTTAPTGFQPVSQAGGLDLVWSAPVCAAIDELLGTSDVHRERPRVLMTFPSEQKSWTVPRAGWHFDYVPLRPEPGLRALQVFVVLSEVLPGGGGTVVLTGSHRLVHRYVMSTRSEPRPKVVRDQLTATHPWLRTLWDPAARDDARPDDRTRQLDDGALVDGVELRIVEAVGAPGDVYLMHSDCFHAVAPNVRDSARIMATSVVRRMT